MYWISVTAVGAFVYFYLKGRKKNEHGASKGTTTERKENKGAAAKAPRSPEEMRNLLDQEPDPWKRHLIYISCLDQVYKKRSEDQKWRHLARDYAQAYVKEFPDLKPAVFENLGEAPKMVPAFKQLAILFEEDQEYEKAVDICENAMVHGLVDGTKTGYEGRMERLSKKLKAGL
ncbi:MAG: hypothetical protein NDI81_09460 [Desulfobacula sp.]|nr:hypothetical protein [Desulfobacula sp.]